MLKKTVILLLFSLILNSNIQVFAKSGMQDLQDLPTSNQVVDTSKSFNDQHWAYKSLENISKKYGLLMGKPGEAFDRTKPLTRNEAAVILVNLTGKIEQDRAQLSEAEKVQIDILKQELSQEITALAGRVATLETSVDTLKGNVAKIESSSSNNWKSSYAKDVKITGGMQLKYAGNISKGSAYPSNFSIPLSDVTVSGMMAPHLKYFTQMFPSRNYDSSAKGMLGDVNVSTDIIPHHNIYVGQSRVPIGVEGTQSPYTLDTIDRAQIARNFADFRDTGIKIAGSYPFVDYYLGAFNGNGNNAKDTNNQLEYASWATFKPLYKYPKIGSVEVGGGFDFGKNTVCNHNNVGLYLAYKYKKYAIKSEYSSTNGYLAPNRRANGLYISNSYFLTKKLQLVARYDQFDSNKGIDNNLIREYTFGTNYFVKNQNIKIQANYVYVANQLTEDSNRFVIMTQYML